MDRAGAGKTTLCQRVTEEMHPELQQDPARLPIGIPEVVAGESAGSALRLLGRST